MGVRGDIVGTERWVREGKEREKRREERKGDGDGVVVVRRENEVERVVLCL